MLVTPPVYDNNLIGGPYLHDLGLLAPFLDLSFLGWGVSLLLHNLLSLLILLSLFINRVKLGDLCRRQVGRLWLNCLFRDVAPNVGL